MSRGVGGMELFVVIVSDRHTDAEVYPFSTESAALDYAQSAAEGWLVVDPEPPAGWLFSAEHPSEEDSIWVVRRFVDEPARKA